MPTRQTPSAYFLVADDRADVVKDLTIALRGFFAECLVEAAYSRQDLAYVASRRDWDITVVQEDLLEPPAQSLSDLRRHAPQSTILVLGERDDWQWAQRMLSHGADSYLCRTSPSFPSQLLITSRLLLERRQLATRLERSEHYLGLIEQLSDVVYELDAMGRFLHVSPAITPLLGYQPLELIGQPYTVLVAGEDQAQAAGRLNERRTGDRATRHFSLRMLGKQPGAASATPVPVELSATGLYGPQQEFLGTVGLLKDASRLMSERERAQQLEQQLRNSEDVRQENLSLRQQTERYRASLSQVSTEAQALMSTLGALQLEPRLARLHEESARALEGAPAKAIPLHGAVPPTAERPAAASSSPPAAPQPQPAPLPIPEPPVVPPPAVPTDRRRAPRLACALPTKLQCEGQTWEGVTRDIGLGGLMVTVLDDIEARQSQAVQVSLNSDIGMFELRGAIRAIREWDRSEHTGGSRPALGLAIEFGPFGPYEEQILGSMIQGLTEQSIQLQASITLLPEERESPTGRSEHLHHEGVEETEDRPRLGAPGTGLSPERRLDERAKATLQIRFEPCGPPIALSPLSGRTADVSVSGCCLTLQAPGGLVGLRGRVTFLPQPAGSARGKPNRHAITVLADVLWTAPDTMTPAALRDPGPPPSRVGVRFLHVDRDSEQRLRDLMARLLPNGNADIVTVTAEGANDAGQRIAIVHDHPRKPLPAGSPAVILAPGFGETKREWVELAHWLCMNGFHVLRYDHTSHVGESDGPMERTTLGAMRQDLRSVIDLAERLLPASPLAVIGHNLSGRVALKVAAADPRIKLLVLLGCVVDLQSTLHTVHREDLIAAYRTGVRLGRTNLLGFTIDADRWLGDAITGQFCTLAETISDAESVQAPVIFLAAEQDPWGPLAGLKSVQNALQSNLRQLSLLTAAPRQLRDDPRTSRAFHRQLVSCCLERFYPLAPKGQVTAAEPLPAIRQAERERVRARQRHSLAKLDLVDFWQTYLDHFHQAARSSDFWHLYDHLYRLLGTTDKGGTILDAGCGHGEFGMLLSLNHAYRHRAAAGGTPWSTTYVGLDVVPAALQQAGQQLALVADEIKSQFPTSQYPHVLIRSALTAGDLDQPLPFRNGQFDRIVCNLTLCFLRDPVGALREMVRVLTPGGRLVVSVLTRHADLSPFFAAQMQRAVRPEDAESARWLWTQWGVIREAEANGVFRFFDRQELIRLFKACGTPRPRLYPALGEQGVIVVAEKSLRST